MKRTQFESFSSRISANYGLVAIRVCLFYFLGIDIKTKTFTLSSEKLAVLLQ